MPMPTILHESGEVAIFVAFSSLLFAIGRSRRNSSLANQAALVATCFGKTSRVEAKLRAALGDSILLQVCPADEGIDAMLAETHALVVSPADGQKLAGIIAKCPKLRLIQSLAAGVDFIDSNKLRIPPGVTVCRASSMTHSIAEYVLCTILSWCIGMFELSQHLKQGRAFKPPFMPPLSPFHMEAHQKTLGIIGMGDIGTQIAVRAAAFNMRVVGLASRKRAGPCPAPLIWIDAGPAALRRLLTESDFVVLACPLNAHTEGLIGAAELALMKPTAVLVNIARGPVVDQEALYNALRDKVIRGATIDVWYQYPRPGCEQVQPSSFPFHELPNCVMTPHMSGWTHEQEQRKIAQLASNIKAVASAIDSAGTGAGAHSEGHVKGRQRAPLELQHVVARG